MSAWKWKQGELVFYIAFFEGGIKLFLAGKREDGILGGIELKHAGLFHFMDVIYGVNRFPVSSQFLFCNSNS